MSSARCLFLILCSALFLPHTFSESSANEGICSVTGHTLLCHRSSDAAHVFENWYQFKTEATSITEIRITDCNLTHVPDVIWTKFPLLTTLDLSGNHINEFTIPVTHPSVQQLNLSRDPHLESVDLESVFQKLPSLLLIDFSGSQIGFVGANKPVLEKRAIDVRLSEASLHCGNDTAWLMSLSSPEVQKSSSLRIVADDARCHSGPLDGVFLTQSYSSWRALTHPTCRLCDCSFKPRLQVNCSGRGLYEFPKSLPYETKSVDLRNNKIERISLAHDWKSVIYLHLENNRIDSLNGLEGNGFARNIRFLNLATNRLTEIPVHVLKQLNVEQIILKDNPWQCDCNTIAFQLWIQDHSAHIADMDQIRCAGRGPVGRDNGVDSETGVSVNSVLSGRTIYRILRSELCPQPLEGSIYQFYDFASLSMAVLTVFIICKLMYDWWWQRRTGKLPRFFKLNV